MGDMMSNQLVSEHDVQEALQYLAKADTQIKPIAMRSTATDKLLKVILAKFHISPANPYKSAKDREMWALAQDEYTDAVNAAAEAHAEEQAMRLKCDFHAKQIDIFRTLQANQRRGNI